MLYAVLTSRDWSVGTPGQLPAPLLARAGGEYGALAYIARTSLRLTSAIIATKQVPGETFELVDAVNTMAELVLLISTGDPWTDQQLTRMALACIEASRLDHEAKQSAEN